MRDGITSAFTLVEVLSARSANAFTVLPAEVLHRKIKHNLVGAELGNVELHIGDFYNFVAFAVGQPGHEHTLGVNLMVLYGFLAATVARCGELHTAGKICGYDTCTIKNLSLYGNGLFYRTNTEKIHIMHVQLKVDGKTCSI